LVDRDVVFILFTRDIHIVVGTNNKCSEILLEILLYTAEVIDLVLYIKSGYLLLSLKTKEKKFVPSLKRCTNKDSYIQVRN